ncbi:MAG TPA: HEAT repeat domain-containing protein, partial [Verrucomicrobiota bacterium]|nr:HEAT repeat domain-containing protein [Verrucomicrobiota bacterium]
MRRVSPGLLAVLLAPGGLSAADHPVATPDSFELHPALELSLFAAEPGVVDPVAIAFDEFGRAYVAECRDYPYGVGPDGRVGSTIRLLEDTDGDGRADKATVFARGLSFATSVTPWRGGVLVTAAPDLVFLKDTDGDGVADVREVIITGFRRGVSDSLVNGLRFHFDGWIHGANGGSGGTLSSPKRPGLPVRLGDRDFRFRPDTGEIELTTHTGGGFGLVFDDWGRSFTTYNINHIQQRVAEADAFTRFPGSPPVETTHSISDHGDMARLFPIAPAVTRPNHPEQAGHFSAAGGMGHIGHAAWPGNLPGSVLVCDVVGNLVHRDVLSPDGPILRASRAPEEQDREFFASRDLLFRPVNLELGPDGALFLLDMQREIIEHPDYIPKKTLAGQDVRAGQDRGRIYRLLPKGAPKVRDLPGRAAPTELVTLLGSPNQWTRLTAHRLLLERGETSVAPALKDILHGRAPRGPDPAWEPARPEARVQLAALRRLHALTLLEGLAALDDDSLLAGLADAHPGVRVEAVRQAGRRAANSPRLAAAVQQALADPDAAVRMTASLAAAQLPRRPELIEALAAQLRPADVHAWNRRAVLAAL